MCLYTYSFSSVIIYSVVITINTFTPKLIKIEDRNFTYRIAKPALCTLPNRHKFSITRNGGAGRGGAQGRIRSTRVLLLLLLLNIITYLKVRQARHLVEYLIKSLSTT